MSRRCPDDAAPLDRREFHGVALDVCPECAGVYFDEGEIAVVQSDGPEALTQLEQESMPSGLVLVACDAPKRCPGCAGLMCAYTYRYSSDICLDGCAACGGVWVQDGELARIARHLQDPPSAVGGTRAAHREAASQNAAHRHALSVGTVVRALH